MLDATAPASARIADAPPAQPGSAPGMELVPGLAPVVPRLSGPVRAAFDHLLANFTSQVSLTDLAALTQRTPFHLIRAFRKELGVTPHAMLIRIRILRATALLARGEPIAGVAADLGFVDQTHFGRHFKRIHKETPGRFQTAARMHRPLGTGPGDEARRAA